MCTQSKAWSIPLCLSHICQEGPQGILPLPCDHGAFGFAIPAKWPRYWTFNRDKFTCEFTIPLSGLRALGNKLVTKQSLHLVLMLWPHLTSLLLTFLHLPGCCLKASAPPADLVCLKYVKCRVILVLKQVVPIAASGHIELFKERWRTWGGEVLGYEKRKQGLAPPFSLLSQPYSLLCIVTLPMNPPAKPQSKFWRLSITICFLSNALITFSFLSSSWCGLQLTLSTYVHKYWKYFWYNVHLINFLLLLHRVWREIVSVLMFYWSAFGVMIS